MISFNPQVPPVVVDNHISVKDAAEFSGYSLQYLRRLLRAGKLEGLKIGQIWLIEMESIKDYLKMVTNSQDQRLGPQ